jgi:hypothetical protein
MFIRLPGRRDTVAYSRTLPHGYWAVPIQSGNIKIWPKIAEEYATGM